MISICGLRLEKMLAILSKKKDTIRVESVNTNPEFGKFEKDKDKVKVNLPEFLGINYDKKYYFDKIYDDLDRELMQ